MLKPAVACGKGLHQYFPRDLTLPSGKYHWKVWSPSISATDHEQQVGFEGEFDVPDSYSDERRIIWPTRNDDSFYCLDIFNFDTNEMTKQAAACGEHLHSYSPAKLDLPPARYRPVVWSPSVKDYPNYEDKAFFGYFETTSTPIPTDKHYSGIIVVRMSFTVWIFLARTGTYCTKRWPVEKDYISFLRVI